MSEVTLFFFTTAVGSASVANSPDPAEDDSDEDSEARAERSAAAGMVGVT